VTVILASHLPGQPHFESRRFKVIPVECVGDFHYWQGWTDQWPSDQTIVNVEHDMECSDTLIQELLDCPEPLCTHAYTLYLPSVGAGPPHYAQRTGPKPPAGGEWLNGGEEWCDFTGIGFCKITPRARVAPLERVSWQTVDCSVALATEGRWHVHWPGVEHDHR
jgi:hypothetical protein